MQNLLSLLLALWFHITQCVAAIKLTETTRVTTESNNYDTLSLDFETTLTLVRDIKVTLADYNLAFDKLRNSVDPDDIEIYEKQLVVRNKEFKNKIDEVFWRRRVWNRRA